MTIHSKLAIDGGKSVRDEFLVFGGPCLGDEEIDEVVETLRSGWIGTGPRVERFESDFAAYVNAPYAVSLNSCTAGLFLSLLALGISPGDEVITTPLTFAATANVVEHLGAKVVFADINPHTLNIDPEKVRQAVTPRTKAIVPVHFGGLSCDMDALQALAAENNLQIVEDAAHATGTRYKGKMVGSLGNLTVFSFYANKNLTTAEGGMVTLEDPELEYQIRLLRLHGLSQDAWKRYGTRRLMKSEVVLAGYKYNMPDLAAALGVHQLQKQEGFLEIRERYARIYDEAFAGLPLRRQPRPKELDMNRHALHLYILLLEPGRWHVHRNQVVEALRAENIGAAVHYGALHTHPYYLDKYDYAPSAFPNAFEAGDTILTLPLTPCMGEEDIGDVISAVHKITAAYAI